MRTTPSAPEAGYTLLDLLLVMLFVFAPVATVGAIKAAHGSAWAYLAGGLLGSLLGAVFVVLHWKAIDYCIPRLGLDDSPRLKFFSVFYLIFVLVSVLLLGITGARLGAFLARYV